MKNRLSVLSRSIALVCALSLIAVLFLPIWKIELSAPQYPEGLTLKIYANKLGGNVDVVNGLNHYIGMRTLHEKDFVEFQILPYIIAAFVVFGLLTAFINRKWLFTSWISCYLLFAIVAMIDFYRWEYDYGHNLDPAAPIQVPGMSYQPPLIGFKQLLNFGAYSIPDSGGWIFIGVGLLLTAAGFLEIRSTKRQIRDMRRPLTVAALLCLIFLSSCSTGPQPIQFGQDGCAYCKMTILDQRYGGEIVTKKGKVYKFDDIHCISLFLRSHTLEKSSLAGTYLLDFTTQKQFIKANESFLLHSSDLHSPMGSNTAAFDSELQRKHFKQQVNGTETTWNELNK
jgi:copper chaperone NosL